MPTATVKVSVASERASWWAAIGSAPSRAASTPATEKKATSTTMWRPVGSPTRTARAQLDADRGGAPPVAGGGAGRPRMAA